jgi:putative transposase
MWIASIPIMTRKRFLQSTQFPYHINSRCINKDWFSIPLEDVWQLMSDYLFFIHHAFEIKIYSFVLMSNHFHLMAGAPEKNLSEAMRYLMTEVSRSIGQTAGRINQTFGGRFHRSLIDNDLYFAQVYKYVYRNPIRAGICEKAEDYKFSTLPGLLGKQAVAIPLEEDIFLFQNNNAEKYLRWLNQNPAEHIEERIKKALKKSHFKFPKNNNGTLFVPEGY